MIRDITLGQYYSSDSIIHRLDARLKIVASVLFIVELFVVNNFWGFCLCALALAVVVKVSKVPFKFIMRGMKPILMILLFTFCLNMFMVPGHVIFRIGFLKLTSEGLYTAVFMAIRLILLIIGTSLLTFTTKPINLTDGIENLLTPLCKIGVPTHELAMMMSIALRFIPTLLEETDKIMKAQQARGADFETGNLIARAKALIPILVPLFVSAFRIAQELAMAMEARCYKGGKGRTRMHQLKLGKADYVSAVLMTAFFAVIICMRIFM